jgi:hypothetical protein
VAYILYVEIALRFAQDNLDVKKSLGPLKKTLEMADLVFFPRKNHKIPHF